MPGLANRKFEPVEMPQHLRRARRVRQDSRRERLLPILGTICVFISLCYIRFSLNTVDTERPARVAFLIQASNTSLLHVPRLLKSIWLEDNIYLIHFDAKIDYRRRERVMRMLKEADIATSGNVLVMDPEPISYAGVSMLVNTLNGISLLLRASKNWDYFINLSAHDYPLASPKFIQKVLGQQQVAYHETNFLQLQDSDNSLEWFFGRRVARMHVDTGLWDDFGSHPTSPNAHGKLIEVNATHPIEKSQIVKTEGWVILHRSFCDYAAHSSQSRRLLTAFATVRAADELFFGTLLLKSKEFKSKVVWDSLRFIIWGMNGKKWSRPAFLDEINLEEMRMRVAKSGALFARKFKEPESDLMDYIDANVSGIAERDWEINQENISRYKKEVGKRIHCNVEKGSRRRFSGDCEGHPI